MLVSGWGPSRTRPLQLMRERPYLEECEAPVVLKENAADAPDITGLCPAQL